MKPAIFFLIHILSLVGMVVGFSLFGQSVQRVLGDLVGEDAVFLQGTLLILCPYLFAWTFYWLLNQRNQKRDT